MCTANGKILLNTLAGIQNKIWNILKTVNTANYNSNCIAGMLTILVKTITNTNIFVTIHFTVN